MAAFIISTNDSEAYIFVQFNFLWLCCFHSLLGLSIDEEKNKVLRQIFKMSKQASLFDFSFTSDSSKKKSCSVEGHQEEDRVQKDLEVEEPG